MGRPSRSRAPIARFGRAASTNPSLEATLTSPPPSSIAAAAAAARASRPRTPPARTSSPRRGSRPTSPATTPCPRASRYVSRRPSFLHRGGSRRARGLARAPSRASEPNRRVDRGVSPPEAWIRHRSGRSVFRQSATFLRGMRRCQLAGDRSVWLVARSKQSAENAFGEHESVPFLVFYLPSSRPKVSVPSPRA